MLVLSERLKQKSLKVTAQRLAIYGFLSGTTEHPNAETMYAALVQQYPALSLATVYKTLDVLCKAGLVQAFSVGDGSFRYDANSAGHPHFICRRCARVYDVHGMGELADLRAEAAARLNAEVEDEQLFFYGVCSSCREDVGGIC